MIEGFCVGATIAVAAGFGYMFYLIDKLKVELQSLKDLYKEYEGDKKE